MFESNHQTIHYQIQLLVFPSLLASYICLNVGTAKLKSSSASDMSDLRPYILEGFIGRLRLFSKVNGFFVGFVTQANEVHCSGLLPTQVLPTYDHILTGTEAVLQLLTQSLTF